jgi:hypothetical protein
VISTGNAPTVEIKMATFTGAEHTRCVFRFEETKSATQVERKFRSQYCTESPGRPTTYSWCKNFVETGCSVCHAKSSGCQFVLTLQWKSTKVNMMCVSGNW